MYQTVDYTTNKHFNSHCFRDNSNQTYIMKLNELLNEYSDQLIIGYLTKIKELLIPTINIDIHYNNYNEYFININDFVILMNVRFMFIDKGRKFSDFFLSAGFNINDLNNNFKIDNPNFIYHSDIINYYNFQKYYNDNNIYIKLHLPVRRDHKNNFKYYNISDENMTYVYENYFDLNFIELGKNFKYYDNYEYHNNKLINLEIRLNLLEDENKKLKEEVRLNHIELHYLKCESIKSKIKYNYKDIKEKNKKLNTEFKRIYKMLKYAKY